MAKGLTEYLLKFILSVILIALAFFAMKKAYNEASTKIMEYLGIYKPSLLERAITCSYYRCYYDLNDPGAKQYTQEACSDFFDKGNYLLPAELDEIKQKISSDYKICNKFSMANPVVVSLSKEKDAKLNKEMIKTSLKKLKCILYEDTEISGKSITDYLKEGFLGSIFPIYGIYKAWKSSSSSGDIIYLDLSTALLSNYETEECKIGDDTANPSLTSATLKAGDYYVYTLEKDGKYTTVVTKEKDPGYIKLHVNEEKELTLASEKEISSYSPGLNLKEWLGRLPLLLIETIPSNSKYVFFIEEIDYDGSNVIYPVEYDMIDNKMGFTTKNLQSSEYLDINTPDGCLKLKFYGVGCSEDETGMLGTSCSGEFKVKLRLVPGSC